MWKQSIKGLRLTAALTHLFQSLAGALGNEDIGVSAFLQEHLD